MNQNAVTSGEKRSPGAPPRGRWTEAAPAPGRRPRPRRRPGWAPADLDCASSCWCFSTRSSRPRRRTTPRPWASGASTRWTNARPARSRDSAPWSILATPAARPRIPAWEPDLRAHPLAQGLDGLNPNQETYTPHTHTHTHTHTDHTHHTHTQLFTD